MIDITLEPLGKKIAIEPNGSLQDLLLEFGVEFPCGGEGLCGNCKVRLLEGNLAINDIQRDYFTDAELADGWRLACQCRVTEPATLELVQWEMRILSDDQKLKAVGRSGTAIAVDLGTTSLVAQRIDLKNGTIVGTQSALNPQAKYGADIMSRIDYGIKNFGARNLQKLIRDKIESMIRDLIHDTGTENTRIKEIVIVGNTVMHHLFCGMDVSPMARVPFETENGGEFNVKSSEIGWNISGNPTVQFLPCIGGFVGSDVLAGMVATEMHSEDGLVALIDLGTNGEVVVGSRQNFLCASTAAGPAFEGAKISMGMRATSGAISKVTVENGQFVAHVIGGGPAKGICGSGLVDAVACGLELGLIDKSGRIIDNSDKITVQSPVFLKQQDIRELQLAKAAIAAGLEILAHRLSKSVNDIEKITIAGAFGNYINVSSAIKIGLLSHDFPLIIQAGNTALHGAKKIAVSDGEYQTILQRTHHVSLGTDTEFMDRFVENMNFFYFSKNLT